MTHQTLKNIFMYIVDKKILKTYIFYQLINIFKVSRQIINSTSNHICLLIIDQSTNDVVTPEFLIHINLYNKST